MQKCKKPGGHRATEKRSRAGEKLEWILAIDLKD